MRAFHFLSIPLLQGQCIHEKREMGQLRGPVPLLGGLGGCFDFAVFLSQTRFAHMVYVSGEEWQGFYYWPGEKVELKECVTVALAVWMGAEGSFCPLLEALFEPPPHTWRQPSYIPLRNSLIYLTAQDSRSFGLDLVLFRLRMISYIYECEVLICIYELIWSAMYYLMY